MPQITPKDRIILPLDVPTVAEARRLVNLLSAHVGLFKLGLEFIWSMIADLLSFEEGPAVALLQEARTLAREIDGPGTFVDGKLCDIPNTVKGASIAISRLDVKFFNVHASAGMEAIKAAVANKGNSQVLGVTVLTSISGDECVSIFGDEPGKKVLHFANNLVKAGADGIICSPQELTLLGSWGEFRGLIKVTPGVRPEWAATGDQKRVMTPLQAMRAGADYVVIGRPITKPPAKIGGPVEAAKQVAYEIGMGLDQRGGTA